MAKKAGVTEADMRRAIKAAKECGLTIRECIMGPSEVRLIFGSNDNDNTQNEDPNLKKWPGQQG